MAEKEQQHRHQQDRKALQADINDAGEQNLEARRGQVFGFSIGAIAIIAGATAAVMSAEWSGGFIGSAGASAQLPSLSLGEGAQAHKKPPEDSSIDEVASRPAHVAGFLCLSAANLRALRAAFVVATYRCT